MASTPPLIFKRPKSKTTSRTRQSSPENDEPSSGIVTGEGSPSALAARLKNKVKRSQPKSRLSFGGDDEEESGGEVFQVKKSNLSRKLTLEKKHPSIPFNLDQATITPQLGPTYDKEHLQQLKAATPTSRPSSLTNSYDADVSMDIQDVSFGDLQSAEVTDASETLIPSESRIKSAKERRERLKKTGVSTNEDYISLSVVQRDKGQGPHPESRLMREEDEIGEGDDEYAEYTSAQERIALGKKSRKLEATKRREAMKEMIIDAEEEDDETLEWEQEQLRRGGLTAVGQGATPSAPKPVYKPAPIPLVTPIPTLGPAIARLTEQLSQLTTSHASNTAALNSLALERAEIDMRESEMRDMVEKAEEKRAWFGNFREWVESVAGFLDEKYPMVEKLEEEHILLLKERRDMINLRTREDDEDDLESVLGPLPAPGLSEAEAEEVDELGRVIPPPNHATLKQARREERIRRRKLRQQQHGQTEEEEGYSTDDTLAPEDASAYTSALETLADSAKEVLADVKAQEFRDPGKGRWSTWRDKYSDSYVGAWGGLGVVSAWEFWARLEMVGWDCIEDPRGLDSFKWYQGLYEYSRSGGEEDQELGPDGDLVASMLSTAIIPRLCAVISGGALDVYSGKQVRRMIDLAEEVEASVEQGNAKLQTLLKAAATLFQNAVDDTETVIAKHKAVGHSVPTFDPESVPARRRFLARRIKLLRNLLKWRKFTGERFGVGSQIERLVERCVLDLAEGGWDVGGQEIAQKIASILPPELTPYELKRCLGMH